MNHHHEFHQAAMPDHFAERYFNCGFGRGHRQFVLIGPSLSLLFSFCNTSLRIPRSSLPTRVISSNVNQLSTWHTPFHAVDRSSLRRYLPLLFSRFAFILWLPRRRVPVKPTSRPTLIFMLPPPAVRVVPVVLRAMPIALVYAIPGDG